MAGRGLDSNRARGYPQSRYDEYRDSPVSRPEFSGAASSKDRDALYAGDYLGGIGGSAPSRRAFEAISGREALEREYAELQAEKQRGQEALDGLAERIQSLRQEVEAQRRRKPASCASCRAVTLQVDAAAQSLLGSAGHVARTLLRDANADRRELLETVLRYMEPVKHLDPDLEDLYERAQTTLAVGEPSPGGSPVRRGATPRSQGLDAGPRGGTTPRGGNTPRLR